MNYQLHYDNLINTRKLRNPDPNVYYEKHHIIMRSLGGTNDKENLVLLTAREHFLAHWLLWRIHRNRESAFAFSCMKQAGNKNRFKINSARGYEEARIAYSTMPGPMTGKFHSEETKKKYSVQRSGEKNAMFGKTQSLITRRKIALKSSIQCKGVNNPRARKLYQYENDKLLKIWDYCKDCYDFYGISASYMSASAKHNSSNPSNFKKLQGFIFTFNPISK